MKDKLGLYYYPTVGNSRVRVYVRENADGQVEFRLWHADMPGVWERHEWLNYDVLQAASNLYREERSPDRNPLGIYDLAVARALLREDQAGEKK